MTLKSEDDPVMQTTILLIEDDKTTSRIESEFLKKEGYQVITAFTGEEAVDITGRMHDQIGLILMDIDLGTGMDGTDTARIILARHDIPVLFLSSHMEKEVVEKTETITSYGYVVKGSGSIVLAASIKMALKLHRANSDVMQKNREIQSINNSLNSTIDELENTNRGLLRTWEKLLESEKELMESRNEFMGYFNMNTVGMSVISPDKKWIRANERLCSMLGYSQEELSSMTWTQITHPDDLPEVINLFSGMLSGQLNKYEIRKRFISRDGRPIYTLAHVTCRRNTKGAAKYILASFVDLTEQNRMERDLLDRERRYSALLKNLPGMVFRSSPAERHTMEFISDGCHDLTGYSPRELFENNSQTIMDLVVPEFRDELKAGRERALAEGKNFEGEYQIICADGSLKWVWEHGRGIKGSEKTPIYYEGYIEDITERKLVEIVLHHREEKFDKAFHNAPLIMTISEIGDGMYLEVNNMFEKKFGFPREEALGRTSIGLELITPEDRARMIDTVRKDGRAAGLEIIYYAKSKKPIMCLYHGEVITLDGKKCLLSLIHDITDIKMAEQKLRDSEERISRSLREKEVLLAEIHHRVKNNMQIVTSLLSLQSDLIEDDSARDSFRECICRIQSMALVHEKLYNSDDMASINFHEFISDLADKIFFSAGSEGGRIRKSISADESIIGIDLAIPCGLIITELLTNALKHAFPGGRDGDVHIGLKKLKSGYFVMTVRDNGIGIDSDDCLEKNSTLGFTLLNALVKQVKGDLKISAKNGTEIKVKFPCTLPQGKFPPALMNNMN